MKFPRPVTVMTGIDKTDPEPIPNYDGDKVAKKILETATGDPLPSGTIGSLTRAWERLMESNPEAFLLMKATMAVLERIDTVDRTRDINHGDKPDVLWASLGYKVGGTGRHSKARNWVVAMMVCVLENDYAENDTDVANPLTAARNDVVKITGIPRTEVNKHHRDVEILKANVWHIGMMSHLEKLYTTFK